MEQTLNKQDNILNYLSKYRNSLMGIAILWIVIHHSQVPQNINFIVKWIFFDFGNVGVDLFLFLSGFGIFYSLTKNSDSGEFFIRRICRLLPAIPILILFIYYTQTTSFHVIIGYLTLLNYWLDIRFFGYLSYAFMCYVLSPTFVDIINNHLKSYKNQIIFLIFLFILTIPFWMDERIQGVSRIMIYTVGLYAGYYSCNKKEISKELKIFLIIISILAISITPIFLYILFNPQLYIRRLVLHYAYGLFAPGFCIAISLIMNNLNFLKINIILKNVLDFIGTKSLEIFMIDSFITSLFVLRGFFKFNWYEHILFALIMGILYHYLFKGAKNVIIYIKRFFANDKRIK